MKYLLIGLIISIQSFAADTRPEKSQPAPRTEVQKVRSIDFDEGTAVVTFWDTNIVFRMPETAAVIPCLRNGLQSTQKVLLKFDAQKEAIMDCRLYSRGYGDFEDVTPEKQAQEDVKKL